MSALPVRDPLLDSSPTAIVEADARQRRQRVQIWVVAATALCGAIMWFASKALHLLPYSGYEASLLQQPGAGRAILAIFAVIALFFACFVLAQITAGRKWAFGGIFAAALGLGALSIRGGPSRFVYMAAASAGQSGSVALRLAVELLLLFAAIGLVWLRVGKRSAGADPEKARPTPFWPTPAGWQALAAQAGVMAFVVVLFGPTDVKKASLAAVFLGGFVGTSIAEHLFKDEKVGPWYWIGPLVVGLVGYLLAQFSGSAAAAGLTGEVNGPLAALARPLPLDYASFGVAGTLLGYWMGAEHPEVALSIILLNPRIAMYPAMSRAPEPPLPTPMTAVDVSGEPKIIIPPEGSTPPK